MFSPSMDSARDGGAVAGTVLIPMRFVWPYGGRSVYLSGSFTRWSELLQMSPVEGCPTVFQVIHSLAPGYHQYKFFVDGEWRHDEHQPYISGEYGIVNTVLLATDPNFVPGLTPNIVSGSNMDVDNEAFRRMVRLTDGTLSEVLPRISDVDVQTSRQRISAFLSMRTAYELLPESGKVVTLDIDLPVKQAFHILHEQGIPMAPLWDFCKGQFVGVLSALDFILILRELGNHGSNLTEEELETHTISAWKEGKWTAFSRRFIHAGPYDNLKDIAVKILQNEFSTVLLFIHLLKMVHFHSYYILLHFQESLNCIAYTSTSNLHNSCGHMGAQNWGVKSPASCNVETKCFTYFSPKLISSRLMVLVESTVSHFEKKAQVSSIPIVDDNDSLLDIYCRRQEKEACKFEFLIVPNYSSPPIHVIFKYDVLLKYRYEQSGMHKVCNRSIL
ncbi:Immunoglobulin-like fold [Sesbania bispinosa]|nr:Immunoglobulin-like fold [Sesbania bispinosa]